MYHFALIAVVIAIFFWPYLLASGTSRALRERLATMERLTDTASVPLE